MKRNKELAVVILRPKSIFYAWVTEVTLSLEEKMPTNTEEISSGITVLIIPNGQSSEVFTLYMVSHVEQILRSEFSRWTTDETLWPPRFDLELLYQYFDVEVHTTVIDYRNCLENI
ncbi:MAG: hypothetical protein QM652_06810 [Legionella sp.]|uniref:hypothetical protein n=1 Tax=Legionella sp. TaxID=459 RepID=UPI0039E49BD8